MRSLLIILLSSLLTGCGGRSSQNQQTTNTNDSTVFVYYFNNGSKCPSCVQVERITVRVVEDKYSDNPSVKYMLVDTRLSENASLVEKYSIKWNGLIIARGEDMVNLNRVAYPNVVNNPRMVADRIEEEIEKRLAKPQP